MPKIPQLQVARFRDWRGYSPFHRSTERWEPVPRIIDVSGMRIPGFRRLSRDTADDNDTEEEEEDIMDEGFVVVGGHDITGRDENWEASSVTSEESDVRDDPFEDDAERSDVSESPSDESETASLDTPEDGNSGSHDEEERPTKRPRLNSDGYEIMEVDWQDYSPDDELRGSHKIYDTINHGDCAFSSFWQISRGTVDIFSWCIPPMVNTCSGWKPRRELLDRRHGISFGS